MYKNLLKTKNRAFYREKLTENVGKPKELWKSLKLLGLPSKIYQPSFSNFSHKYGEKFTLI